MEPGYEHGKEIGQILQELKNLNFKFDEHAQRLETKLGIVEQVQKTHTDFITKSKIYIGIISFVFVVVWEFAKSNWHRLFEK